MAVLDNIVSLHQYGKKGLAMLVDPDKPNTASICERVNKLAQQGLHAQMVLIGGSTGRLTDTKLFEEVRQAGLPAVLFPGNAEQLTEAADALLLPSVISGRNAEMLIGAHVRAAKQIQALDIEVIPMGYILVDGRKESSVSKVSGTQPIAQENIEEIVQTAIAGELLGKQVIYLEAGSGAIVPVQQEVIKAVRQAVRVPLLVGGGIKTKAMAEQAWLSGADIVVIGNGLE